jgi:hypothetical protein
MSRITVYITATPAFRTLSCLNMLPYSNQRPLTSYLHLPDTGTRSCICFKIWQTPGRAPSGELLMRAKKY